MAQPTPDDDEPGLVDKIAALEAGLPEVLLAVEDLAAGLNEATELFQPAAEKLEAASSSPRPMAARLTILRQMGADLSPIARSMLDTGMKFSTEIRSMDAGVHALIDQTSASAGENDESREQAISLYDSIVGMNDSPSEGLGQLQAFAGQLQEYEGISKDLRPPFRDMRKGLSQAFDALAVIHGWSKHAEDAKDHVLVG